MLADIEHPLFSKSLDPPLNSVHKSRCNKIFTGSTINTIVEKNKGLPKSWGEMQEITQNKNIWQIRNEQEINHLMSKEWC